MDSVVRVVDNIICTISACHASSPGSSPGHGRHGIVILQLLHTHFFTCNYLSLDYMDT